jgi:hypothetical protein
MQIDALDVQAVLKICPTEAIRLKEGKACIIVKNALTVVNA